jgi:hypothetical protein
MNWTYQGRWGYSGLNLVMQPNGVVYFNNFNGDVKSQPITFDDPTAAEAETPGGPSGNIAAFSSASNPRRFTKIGTYTWRSKDALGNEQVGQVTVKPNPT